MSSARISWKGVIAVVLSSVVVSTADQLFAQLNMMGEYRTAAPMPGPDIDQTDQVTMDEWRAGLPQPSPILEQQQPAYQMRPYESGPSSQQTGAEPYDAHFGMPSQTFYGEGDVFLRQHTGFGKPSVCEWMAAKPIGDEQKKDELQRLGCDPAEWMNVVPDNSGDMPHITCADGRTFPSRSEDGSPINYLMDPCGRGGSVEPVNQLPGVQQMPTDPMPREYGLPSPAVEYVAPGFPSSPDMPSTSVAPFRRPKTGYGYRNPIYCEWVAGLPEGPQKDYKLLNGGCGPEWGNVVPDNPWDMPLQPEGTPPVFRGMQPSVGMPSGESVAPQSWEEMIAVPPAQPESDAMPPIVDSAAREIIENLATQLGNARGENARLQQEIDGLRSLVQQLQNTIISLSSASLPLHDAAEEVPADRAMPGENTQDAAKRSDAGMEVGVPAEPIGAEPEQGAFGKVLDWFGF